MSQQVQIREADINNIIPLLAKGVVHLATKHYIISSLWVMGLITLSFFQGIAVPQEKLLQYDKIMNQVDHSKLVTLQQDLWVARDRYHQSKGWFSCDQKCQMYKDLMNENKAALRKLEKEQDAVRREANSHLGIFSTYGVEETKASFWKSFKWAKSYGKRATFWDMLFVGFRSMRRDESIFEYILTIMMHFLINMSLGMITALFGFLFSLWSVIRSYQPDFLTGLAFFFGAAVAAVAMVATYLTLLYGATIGTAVVAVKAKGLTNIFLCAAALYMGMVYLPTD